MVEIGQALAGEEADERSRWQGAAGVGCGVEDVAFGSVRRQEDQVVAVLHVIGQPLAGEPVDAGWLVFRFALVVDVEELHRAAVPAGVACSSVQPGSFPPKSF